MEMVSSGFGALFCNLGHLGTNPLLSKYMSSWICLALEEDKTEQDCLVGTAGVIVSSLPPGKRDFTFSPVLL